MNKREKNIVEAAIRIFTRYGIKRATMNDIAEEAGIARQTLYNAFSNKEEVLKAILRFFADDATAHIEAALERTTTLAERLDAVFTYIAVKPYEQLNASPNAMDIIDGFNAAGRKEIDSAKERFRIQITGILTPYEKILSKEGTTAAELADFIQTSASAAKHNAQSKKHLVRLLGNLKMLVLKVTGEAT